MPGNPTWDTNVDVTLESYEYEDDAEEMLDIKVSIELKQYKKFGTKKVKVQERERCAATMWTRQNEGL